MERNITGRTVCGNPVCPDDCTSADSASTGKVDVTRIVNSEESNQMIWIKVGEARICLPKDISVGYLVGIVKGLA